MAVGVDAAHPLGQAYGDDAPIITAAQLPSGHTPGAPVNNDQRSLPLHYIIATDGVFAGPGGNSFNPTDPLLGEISLFAGNYAPSGWMFADGQILQIRQNAALFAEIGNLYGGDGVTTFALPDLQGRVAVGSGGGYVVGETFGSDTFQLTGANLPSGAPEASGWSLMLVGVGALGAFARRRKGLGAAR